MFNFINNFVRYKYVILFYGKIDFWNIDQTLLMKNKIWIISDFLILENNYLINILLPHWFVNVSLFQIDDKNIINIIKNYIGLTLKD